MSDEEKIADLERRLCLIYGDCKYAIKQLDRHHDVSRALDALYRIEDACVASDDDTAVKWRDR